MNPDNDQDQNKVEKIAVKKNGPYVVAGEIKLVHKTQVSTEYGEPIAWKKDSTYKTCETYYLCRCGRSNNKPFCDGTHRNVGFDGTETAESTLIAERQTVLPGGVNIVVKRDRSLCSRSGFCGNRFTNIEEMVAETGNTRIRSQVIAMIERCPSGSYTYAIEEDEADIEPDLPKQVSVTTEMTSEGPIMGPLWVTGNILIERSDAQPFQTRNRVTLCRCGLSDSKPLCDGKHRAMGIKED
jgi:CDGSH-type Zn-finger protein